MLKAIQYETVKKPQNEVISLPGGRLVSFPFLANVSANAVSINPECEIESFLFDPPSNIPLENIICPKKLGHLDGEIFTREIVFSAEGQYYLIHLVNPIDIKTRFLGSITIRALQVDLTCALIGFIRNEIPL